MPIKSSTAAVSASDLIKLNVDMSSVIVTESASVPLWNTNDEASATGLLIVSSTLVKSNIGLRLIVYRLEIQPEAYPSASEKLGPSTGGDTSDSGLVNCNAESSTVG